MKRRHQESEMQRSCVTWFRLQYPNIRLNLFAVPNGGARTPVEGAIMKGEGVTAGVADLILLFPAHGYHALCIEMKTPTGSQRPTQKQWQAAVEATGYKYTIVRSFDEFVAIVRWYLE